MSYEAERSLSMLYPLVIATCAICCISSSASWAHWRYVLNGCPESNCGCYLHARSTYSGFEGGSIGYCYFANFGPILPLLFALVLGIYHGYRICMGTTKKKSGVTTLRQRSGEMIVVTAETELTDNEVSPYYWIPAITISSIMLVYMIVYASMYTDGFGVTCKQYREALLKQIQGVGNIVPVIKGRLSCAAIFDFMDFLVEGYSYERRKYGRINSGIALYFTLICAWLAVLGWLLISIINIVQGRKTRAARV